MGNRHTDHSGVKLVSIYDWQAEPQANRMNWQVLDGFKGTVHPRIPSLSSHHYTKCRWRSRGKRSLRSGSFVISTSHNKDGACALLSKFMLTTHTYNHYICGARYFGQMVQLADTWKEPQEQCRENVCLFFWPFLFLHWQQPPLH